MVATTSQLGSSFRAQRFAAGPSGRAFDSGQKAARDAELVRRFNSGNSKPRKRQRTGNDDPKPGMVKQSRLRGANGNRVEGEGGRLEQVLAGTLNLRDVVPGVSVG
jgi:hypothetical protein